MGIEFGEIKASLCVRNNRLYEHGNVISPEPEISELVVAINLHPEACTESSCQGHFGTFLGGSRVTLDVNGEFLRLHDNGMPFQDSRPDIDLKRLEFFYDRAEIGLVISESETGKRVSRVVEDWVDTRRDVAFMRKNYYSASENGRCITFSPDQSAWAIDTSGGYPISRLRKYSFYELLRLNADRLKSFAELSRLFVSEGSRAHYG